MMTIMITGSVLLVYFNLSEGFLLAMKEFSFIVKMTMSFAVIATIIQDVAEIKKNLTK